MSRVNSGVGSVSTPTSAAAGGLRRRILDRNHKANTKSNVTTDKTVLNTAFCRMTSASPGSRSKLKSTSTNAAYTPSSLYRNVNKTPNKIPTPLARVDIASKKSEKVSNAPTPENQTEMSNLMVAVRVRPFNAYELNKANVKNAIAVNGNELIVTAGTNADASIGVSHSFSYDYVYNSSDPESKTYASQNDVFMGTAMPLIDRAFEGYNACLFAYGQTGSGKSYSMMGFEPLDVLSGTYSREPNPEAGIIPRFCNELFRRIESVKESLEAEIEISYFEIYNEKIHDLLCVTANEQIYGTNHTTFDSVQANVLPTRNALKVREHPVWGPYVVNLSIHPVDSYESLRNWLAVGNSQRATAATGMNSKSSRSHSIFNIVLNLTELEKKPGTEANIRHTRRSKISLVDLAGSERISSSQASEERIREGVSINKSLLTLGKVIASLSESRKSTAPPNFVPYRESVLTWLLRENLGGNSKTVMLATISPANIHIDETLATLRYACQARSIVNRVKVNESPHDKIIRELRAEVDRLTALRNEYERQKRLSPNVVHTRARISETADDDSEVEALRQQLLERERELRQAQKSWMERLQEAESRRKSELRLLKRKGLALELSSDQKQACLVNLTADPILSDTLFYLLPPGKVRIGRTRSSVYCNQPDIMLDGQLVAIQHCIIDNIMGKLYITPENDNFESFLNGELLTQRQQMFHGDRLVIGGSHYFRVSNPLCQNKDKNMVVDFQQAHQEIMEKQEEKLRLQLEEEKQAALYQIEQERIKNERDFHDRMQKLEFQQLQLDCNTEILESQRKLLDEEKKTINDDKDIPYIVTPIHKSTLLEDIQRIMITPSEKNLHQTQMLVKEATQYCKSLELSYEFRQSQVLDEFGIFRSVVLILDKLNKRTAEWPVARLSVWLDRLRHSEEVVTKENIFRGYELSWKPMEDDLNSTLNDSNCSRISLNLSIVKDAIRRRSMDKTVSPLIGKGMHSNRNVHNPTKKTLFYDDDFEGGNMKLNRLVQSPISDSGREHVKFAMGYIHEMQQYALKLKQLYSSENRENIPNYIETSKKVSGEIQYLESALLNLQNYLEQNVAVSDERDNDDSPKTSRSVRFLID